jgi:hypothetical protein
MPYLMPAVAPALLLAKKVTGRYFRLCFPQRAAILGHAVVAPQYQLMYVDDTAPLEAGIDKNVHQ